MGKPNDGGPAFPTIEVGNADQRGVTYFSCGEGSQHSGLSLRDYFAAHRPELSREVVKDFARKANYAPGAIAAAYAAWSCQYADAMLAERAKEVPSA